MRYSIICFFALTGLLGTPQQTVADDVVRTICRANPSEVSALRQSDPLLRDFYDSMCGFSGVEMPDIQAHKSYEAPAPQVRKQERVMVQEADKATQQVSSGFLLPQEPITTEPSKSKPHREQTVRSTFLIQEVRQAPKPNEQLSARSSKSNKDSGKTEIRRSGFLAK